MSVDRNAKIWNFTPTGTKAHAFVQTSRPGYKRAMCRANVEVLDGNYFFGKDSALSICTRCEKLANAMWDRAETSMMPATEAHDYGYVAPVGDSATQVPDMDAVDEAISHPAVIDALHAEAMKMNREWDKSVAGYAHHYGTDIRSGTAAPRPQRTEAQRNATRDTLRRAIDLKW